MILDSAEIRRILAQPEYKKVDSSAKFALCNDVVQATGKEILGRLEGVLTQCPDKNNPEQCFYWLNDADWEQLRKELGA